MASWSREFLLDFIEIFRSLQPLWLLKSKHYHNKYKRNECYDVLVNKVSTIDPSANRETITKKINNLRSSFRKEFKKVQASLVSGADPDEIYIPKLWYYNELLFLKDQEEPSPSTSSIYVSVEPLESPSAEDSNAESIQSEPSPPPSSRGLKRKQPRESAESEAILHMMRDRFTSAPHTHTHQDDECDIVGKNIATKLRLLAPMQKIYAEKIINDTLFEAQLNTLSRYSVLSTNSIYENSDDNQQTDHNCQSESRGRRGS